MFRRPLLGPVSRTSPIDWKLVGSFALPAWFVSISILVLASFGPTHVGFDVPIYLGATRAWLAGGDPWLGMFGEIPFAAPPPTLLALLPFAVLPDPLGSAAMFATGPILAVVGVRLMRLPIWWLAFPPLVICLYVGNPGAWLPALMFVPPLAVLAKVYAIVPLVVLGRWRAVAATVLILVATIPILPWDKFIADWPGIWANLLKNSGGGMGGPLGIGLVVFVALAIRDRDRAAWLAVPALWPNSQWSYSTIAVPAGWLCAFLCIPFPGAGIAAILAALVEPIVRTYARTWRDTISSTLPNSVRQPPG